MPHDRIHAREPTHARNRWETGVVEDLFERDGHAVFVVRGGDDEHELVVTVAIRDLVCRRLDLAEGESPVGSRVWYRTRGG